MKKVSCIITTEDQSRNQYDAVRRAIHGRNAFVVLIVYPYHDDSSCDWYYHFYLVCANSTVMQQARQLEWKVDDVTKGLNIDLPCLYKCHVSSLNRDAAQRPANFVEKIHARMYDEATQFAQQLEKVL